jgi:Zn-finger nucleic acid-binding protein
LDRGELDKLLEREAAPPRRSEDRRDFDDDGDRYPRRRRSIWTELFD